jgi:branched-chain amino acid transport system ATP-binding protein
MSVLVSIQTISKSFGGVWALRDVTFDVHEGEIVGLVGPNGAGKTTLVRVCMNYLKASYGFVKYKGFKITGLSPHKTCKLGISMTNQTPRPFRRMTCLENVLLSCIFGAGLKRRDALKEAERILDMISLSQKRNSPGGQLTIFEQKLLDFAVALGTNPRFLMLDEPLAGSTEKEIAQIVSIIKKLRDEGLTILWIEHVISEVVKYSDKIVVLNEGRKILEGKPQEVVNDKRFIEAYVGEEVA